MQLLNISRILNFSVFQLHFKSFALASEVRKKSRNSTESVLVLIDFQNLFWFDVNAIELSTKSDVAVLWSSVTRAWSVRGLAVHGEVLDTAFSSAWVCSLRASSRILLIFLINLGQFFHSSEVCLLGSDQFLIQSINVLFSLVSIELNLKLSFFDHLDQILNLILLLLEFLD